MKNLCVQQQWNTGVCHQERMFIISMVTWWEYATVKFIECRALVDQSKENQYQISTNYKF